MLEAMPPLAAVLGALAVGIMSPGPSFVMVARVAVASSRAEGLMAALGMGAGGLLFAGAALAGLQALLLAVPALYLGLKVVGGLYLCWLGVRIFIGARQPLRTAHPAGAPAASARPSRSSRSFWLGLATQVSNPKAAIYYASVFAAFLPQTVSAAFAAGLLLGVFAIEAGWYGLVALTLSSPRPQRAYLAFKPWADRAAGAVMVALGLRLVRSAAPGG